MTFGVPRAARRQAFRWLSSWPLCLWVLGLVTRPCRADELDERPLPVLRYSSPVAPDYPRIVLEQLAVLGGGLAQYSLNAGSNSRDWEFGYDWRSLKARLDGEAYSFDDNRFDTNFLLHPLAGSLYYLTARSNHLGPLGSLAVAFGSSALWEIFGEFREKVSFNDLVVTPLGGMSWGETSTQLGAYFLRACPTVTNELLGATFAPLTVTHDALDGAKRLNDACNVEPAAAHRFRLAVTTGEAWTQGASPYQEFRASLQTEVLHLQGLGVPGTGWSVFADGNLSRFRVSVSLADRGRLLVTDFSLLTQTVVAGLHYRHNVLRASGLERREVVFGWLIGAEYTEHRYDRKGPPDRLFLLDLPAITTRYYGRTANFGWELTLDAGGLFGGVDAFALPEAIRRGMEPDLTAVAKGEGYDHVVGVALSPRARLELGPAELGLDFRSERLFAVRARDGSGSVPTTPVTELRRRMSVWASLGVPRLERFTLSASWLGRAGTVGALRASRDELSLNLGLELAP